MESITSKAHEHKKLGLKVVLHDFSQRQYEDYHQALFLSDAQTVAVKNGAVVKAAIKAGFLTGVTAEQVPELRPAAVIWLTKIVHEHVVEVTTLPPDDPN